MRTLHILILSVFLVAVAMFAALFVSAGCNSVPGTDPVSNVTTPLTPQNVVATAVEPVTKERLEAARLMAPGSMLLFDVIQQDLSDCTERRCDPLGFDPIPSLDPGCPFANTRWTSRINGPVIITPDTFVVSEYDWLFTSPTSETDLCLGIRAVSTDDHFSLLEFNVRAVNPWAYGHTPGNHYGPSQAIYPSNDEVVPYRSVINTDPATAGDVAILVQGINFTVGGYMHSHAYMNTLGPDAWEVFMRDNAFQSGRFYDIVGALKGGPRAFADTPSPADDGAYQSAQVNGDNFDLLSEPKANLDFANFYVCNGGPTPGKDYAFLDIPDINEFGKLSPGEAGFLFVMRREAFIQNGILAKVVVDPSGPPAPITALDLFPAPHSGYNEPAVQAITAPTPHDFSGCNACPAGVHELSISVFFIHS